MNFIENGLYSEEPLLLHTIESLISSDRVFVGNQPDEFAIAGLIKGSNRILMLGLGYGESIRPILAGNQDSHITAVDINSFTLNACSNINDNYFPALKSKITYINDDAFSFISSCTEDSFDCICIDLYTSTGYPLQIVNNSFWENIKKILAYNGTVIINSWGLPQQLSPLKGRTIQLQLAKTLLHHFNYTGYLPHRRNLTFIANKISKPSFRSNVNYAHFKPIDRLILEFYSHRLENIPIIDFRIQNEVEDNLDFIHTIKQFDEEMYNRWPKLINRFNETLISLGYQKINMLSDVTKDPAVAKEVTMQLLINGDIESVTVPILIGSEAFSNSNNLDWYLDWLVTNKESLVMKNKDWFINTAVWQLLSIATNPFSNYGYWEEQIRDILYFLDRPKLTLYNSNTNS